MANRAFWSLALAIAAFGFFASTAQAEPVVYGYWTFDSDTTEGGIIKESSGYQAEGFHDGTLVGSGITFNSIS